MLAGCQYEAQGRRALDSDVEPEVQALASSIASQLPAPDRVYGLDLAHTQHGPRLLELNPFSGMDLYACDLDRIVTAVGRELQAP